MSFIGWHSRMSPFNLEWNNCNLEYNTRQTFSMKARKKSTAGRKISCCQEGLGLRMPAIGCNNSTMCCSRSPLGDGIPAQTRATKSLGVTKKIPMQSTWTQKDQKSTVREKKRWKRCCENSFAGLKV